jgi:hypothetical protein
MAWQHLLRIMATAQQLTRAPIKGCLCARLLHSCLQPAKHSSSELTQVYKNIAVVRCELRERTNNGEAPAAKTELQVRPAPVLRTVRRGEPAGHPVVQRRLQQPTVRAAEDLPALRQGQRRQDLRHRAPLVLRVHGRRHAVLVWAGRRDGYTLDFAGFVALMEKEGGLEEDLRRAFEVFNAVESSAGRITARGLQRVLAQLGDQRSVADCEAMIRAYDVDGDGGLDFHEFQRMMSQ